MSKNMCTDIASCSEVMSQDSNLVFLNQNSCDMQKIVNVEIYLIYLLVLSLEGLCLHTFFSMRATDLVF